MKYTAFNSVEMLQSVNSNVLHQNVDGKFLQTSHCIVFMHTLKTGVFDNTPRCVLVHTKVCTIAHKGV